MNQSNDYDLLLFYFGYKTFTDAADEIIAEYDIGRQHHRFLFFICYHPGITIKQLLMILEISKQGAQSALKTLKDRNLIFEQASENDKRLKELYPTRQGELLIQKLNNKQNRLLKDIQNNNGDKFRNVLEGLSEQRPGFELLKIHNKKAD